MAGWWRSIKIWESGSTTLICRPSLVCVLPKTTSPIYFSFFRILEIVSLLQTSFPEGEGISLRTVHRIFSQDYHQRQTSQRCNAHEWLLQDWSGACLWSLPCNHNIWWMLLPICHSESSFASLLWFCRFLLYPWYHIPPKISIYKANI